MNVDQTLKEIRPNLRMVAPQTFWFSVGFGLFNTVMGFALYNVNVLLKLKVVGIIPMRMWGMIFLLHGIVMLLSLVVNHWKITRSLHFIGVTIKTAWWLELLATFLSGGTPFLLYVWSLLLFLQVIVCIYFTPRLGRA